MKRWNEKSNITTLGEDSFKILLKMNNYLNEKGVRLIVITTPIRLIIEKENINYLIFLDYVNRLKILSKENNFIYINSHDILKLDDSFFVDKHHLNKRGAEKVSNLINESLK